jgi:integrase/recombinase XerD
MLNVRVDQRHDRRALSHEEFTRLLEAAETGPPKEGLLGRDRAMLYVLAAWIGFRRGDIGILMLRNLRLDAEPPIVTLSSRTSARRTSRPRRLKPSLAIAT